MTNHCILNPLLDLNVNELYNDNDDNDDNDDENKNYERHKEKTTNHFLQSPQITDISHIRYNSFDSELTVNSELPDIDYNQYIKSPLGSNVLEEKVDKNDKNVKSVYDTINDITLSIKKLQVDLKELNKKINFLKKEYDKVIVTSTKNSNKKKYNRDFSHSGFTKPRLLSDEICIFLNISVKSKLGQNQVTTKINEYIVNNNLRCESDRRIILPDAKLQKLLEITENEKLSYFNLQKYLKKHFV